MQEVAAAERVFGKIDSYRNEVIRLQKELTAIPALAPSSGGEGEWKKARKAREFMDEIGYDSVKEINCPDESVPETKNHPNQIYTIKGKKSDRTIWIMSHYDIVPPGERRLWNSEPYDVKVEGDEIYGRGVEDNQQGMVSSILAVKALKEEGLQPEYDVSLLFISDEETGNTQGIQHILKEKPDLFSNDDLILVPDSGSDDGVAIEVAEKSILWVKFTTKGKQAHASRPHSGNNAFRAASFLVVKLNDLYKEFPLHDPIFDPQMSTFEPTKKENNVPNINTIPGEDVFYLDCRVLPSYPVGKVKEKIEFFAREIEKEFKVEISIEYPQEQHAAPATPSDAPVVKALIEAIRDVYKVDAKPIGIGGGTVAAYVRKAGLNAVVWSRINETAHQPNEHCSISNVLGDAKVFAHIMLQQ
ncbi:MAG: M20 family metallo-hydrolase [Vulcanimicrobiota bacterium]